MSSVVIVASKHIIMTDGALFQVQYGRKQLKPTYDMFVKLVSQISILIQVSFQNLIQPSIKIHAFESYSIFC